MPRRTARIRHRFSSLRALGIAVEHFPHYVNHRLDLHSVDVVLLSFILSGAGHHHIGDTSYAEHGASLAVTHFGQLHDILTDTEMDVINIYLDPSHHILPALPQPLQQVLPMLLPLHPRLVHSRNRIVRVTFDDPDPPAQHLFAIARELQQRSTGWQEAVLLHWKLFLILCCRQAIDTGFSLPAAERTPIEKLRRYLDLHYAEEHHLPALARRARLTPTSLCRAFKTHTGKAIFHYILERRIEAAMLRLRNGEEKILTVAMEVGFTDLSFFNRKFRQFVGTSPGTYRARFTDNPPDAPARRNRGR